MHEESDGIAENDNSEVVILPDGSHVDESLLSDPAHIREERNNYERKLDEKLRDLGLYEDDMTINQKEELLAVVVISCETAEQEENKRQLIREYLEGAQSLEDEIEFTFQESAWLANEANLLCASTITKPPEDNSSNVKISSSFVDSSAEKRYDGFDLTSQVEKTEIETTPDIFEDETAYADILLEPQASSSEIHSKKQIVDSSKSQSKHDQPCNSSPKIAITYPMLQDQPPEKSKTGDIFEKQMSLQRQKLVLDQSMTLWKPCMSPADELIPPYRLPKKKLEKIHRSYIEEKVKKYLASFEKIASYRKRLPPLLKPVQLNKPFVLLHHGSVAKRAFKLDNYDFIVGINENARSNEEREDYLPCNTLTRAKSAFHRVKPNAHGRLLSFPDNISQTDNPSKSTRSGATYHSDRLGKLEPIRSASPEVILEDASLQTDLGFARGRLSGRHVTVCEEKKLPQFSDLRPDTYKYNAVIAPIVKSEPSLKFNCIPGSSKNPRSEDILVNSIAEFSSGSSSPLIDVETIVDEEIEEFVMKRKSAPDTLKTNTLISSDESKRLKRNDS